jgi:hypothetical protein
MRYYFRQSPVWRFVWLGIVVVLFTACSSQSVVIGTPTPHGTPTQTTGGTPSPDATPTTIPIPSGTTSCAQISDFASAGPASPASGFADLSFPAGSVGITTGPISHVYQFQIVNVCTNATTAAAVQAFYTGKLPASGWTTSSTYPYQANPAAACGTAICWRKGAPRRYISLQDVHSSGSVVVYALWTAIAPLPSYKLTWRSNHVSLPAGAPTTHVTTSCNAGEQMLSGGFFIDSPDGNHSADSTYPSSLTTWTVTAHNASASAITLWSYAGCLSANFSLGMTIVTSSTQAKCPSGGVITGGGYVYHSGSTTFDEGPIPGPLSAPSGPPITWEELYASANVTVYGMCATQNITGHRVAASTSAILTDIGQFTDVVSAACPSGQFLTGGGYEIYDNSFPLIQHYFESAPGPSGNWLVGGYAPGFSSDSEGVGICNSFSPIF